MGEYSAFLVPMEGMMVRDPGTKAILLATGEPKPLVGSDGRYWRRRIRDGSVKVVSPIPQQRYKSVKIEKEKGE